jgi:hypothetical protein
VGAGAGRATAARFRFHESAWAEGTQEGWYHLEGGGEKQHAEVHERCPGRVGEEVGADAPERAGPRDGREVAKPLD